MISNSTGQEALNHQGASALLMATVGFLKSHRISKATILGLVKESYNQPASTSVRGYRRLVRAYEQMGIVMSTWFSNPKFLDKDSRPLPITAGRGPRSIQSLLRASRVSLNSKDAEALMRRSPSTTCNSAGEIVAQRREFMLPEFEIPRAAMVVERYLDTLRRNSVPQTRKTVVLLERNCHVPEVNMRTIAPILRDIKGRGSAFINSVNGDIEGKRLRITKDKIVGEMSVHIFAWTRPSKRRKPKV
ncbi:MAG: hypothetical protein QOI16_4565 [Pseudonocardiales bacterium]|jgi:hypothetical protein|nr:hypothetical protein [Pseudonocardiales bacterium]